MASNDKHKESEVQLEAVNDSISDPIQVKDDLNTRSSYDVNKEEDFIMIELHQG